MKSFHKTFSATLLFALSVGSLGVLLPTRAHATSCGTDDTPCTSPAPEWTRRCCRPSIRCEIYNRRPCTESGHFDYELVYGNATECNKTDPDVPANVFCLIGLPEG